MARAARYRGAAALDFARTAHVGAHAVNRRHVVEHLCSIGSAPARADGRVDPADLGRVARHMRQGLILCESDRS
jgi:hypothetical protein